MSTELLAMVYGSVAVLVFFISLLGTVKSMEQCVFIGLFWPIPLVISITRGAAEYFKEL
jgi:hypothetical protein